MPLELTDTLIVLTWNDPESLVKVMAERGHEIAAVITEAAVFNTGCILPEPGYLELLREETQKAGALLIFDEVITGFRFARGGAQEWFGVTPDLTTLAKGLGGGFPVAAIGGSTEVMSMIADGRYSHSGTYNANVVQCAAVSATMDLLAEPGLYERQRAKGERLADGLRTLRHRRRARHHRRGPRHRLPALVLHALDQELAGRREVRQRGGVHPLVPGDAAARSALSPQPVREPVLLAGAHRRGRGRLTLEAAKGAFQAVAGHDHPWGRLCGARSRHVVAEGRRGRGGRARGRAITGVLPTHRPVPGAAEQSPADWCAAAADVIAALARLVPVRHWGGIGLSGMLPTLVTLDAAGRPTGPALTWEDCRAEAEADGMRGDLGYAATGQWLDGRYLLPMASRLARTEPARMAQSVTLMGAKDYLLHWLTGVAATDPSTATGYGCYDLTTGEWLREGARPAEVGRGHGDRDAGGRSSDGGFLREGMLPAVEPSGTVRPLRGATARLLGLPEGLPVCTGGADSVLGALGLQGAAASPGDVVYIAGTSTVIMGISDRLATDPLHRYLVTPLAVPGRWGLEMDLLSTGSALAWLGRLLALPGGEDELVKLAEGVDAADAPAFHPYLGLGEQGALWNSRLAGTISGLELRHGPAHLARGLVTGIVLESRRCVTVLGGSGDIHVSGRSAASALFLQDLADATGRTVRHPVEGEYDHSAIGAARLAASAIGGLPAEKDYDSRCVRPRPDRAGLWDRLSAHHDEALKALTDLYSGIESGPARVGSGPARVGSGPANRGAHPHLDGAHPHLGGAHPHL